MRERKAEHNFGVRRSSGKGASQVGMKCKGFQDQYHAFIRLSLSLFPSPSFAPSLSTTHRTAGQNARAKGRVKGMKTERKASIVFFRPSLRSISFAPVRPVSRYSSTKGREEKGRNDGRREEWRKKRCTASRGRVGGFENEERQGSGKGTRGEMGRELEEARNSRVPKYSRVERWSEGGGGRRALGVLLKRAKTFPSFPRVPLL